MFDRIISDIVFLTMLLPLAGMVAFLVAGSKALLSKRRRS